MRSDAFIKLILLRRGLRSDHIWMHPWLFREPFRRIPFFLDTWALLKSDRWPRQMLDAFSQKRFRETVRHASALPFWKERFEKNGIDVTNFKESDIAKIPILSKKDFIDRKLEEYTVPELLPKSNKYYTSGSTGTPFAFFHDRQFEFRASAVSDFNYCRMSGDSKRYPLIFMKGDPHMGFDYTKYHFFYSRGYNSIRPRMSELKKLIDTFPKGVILLAIGSSLMELARVCKEMRLTFPLRAVFSVGEGINSLQRKEIENSLKTTLRTGYSMNEFRRIGFQCNHQRIHVYQQILYVEVVDKHGALVSPGTKGRVIVTGFENYVMPLIRYFTGDTGTFYKDPCPCGRASRTIEIQGREVNLLQIGNGRTVPLISLTRPFNKYFNEIRQYQIVRIKQCAFTLRIVPGNNFQEKKVKQAITRHFQLCIHPAVEINWEIVNSIPEGPTGKAVYFIDEFEKRL